MCEGGGGIEMLSVHPVVHFTLISCVVGVLVPGLTRGPCVRPFTLKPWTVCWLHVSRSPPTPPPV